jgi:hypothetical protein
MDFETGSSFNRICPKIKGEMGNQLQGGCFKSRFVEPVPKLG